MFHLDLAKATFSHFFNWDSRLFYFQSRIKEKKVPFFPIEDTLMFVLLVACSLHSITPGPQLRTQVLLCRQSKQILNWSCYFFSLSEILAAEIALWNSCSVKTMLALYLLLLLLLLLLLCEQTQTIFQGAESFPKKDKPLRKITNPCSGGTKESTWQENSILL